MTDREILIFIHQRMVKVHGESKFVDYMHALRDVIYGMPKDKRSRGDVVTMRSSEVLGSHSNPLFSAEHAPGFTAHEAHTPDAMEMAAFSRATLGRRAMEVISQHAGLFTLPGPEALRAEIQKLYEDGQRIKDEMKKRRILLSEVERAR